MNLKMNHRVLAGLAVLAVGAACLAPGWQAQTTAPSASGQPARAVRLSYVDGPVKLLQGDQVLADQAVANTPLLEGMQLTTAANGRAEIQFEDGSVARLAPNSSLTLKVLSGAGTSANAELLLDSGLAYFEFQGGDLAGQMSVRFGDSVVTASGFTVLRVAMDNPPGRLAVFSGNAHLEGSNGSVEVDLHGGESIAMNSANSGGYEVAESIEPDSWDSWNSDRDQALTTEAAAQTSASSDLGENQNPAWNDMDANGNWYNVPGQGYVWSPNDAANAGFDPYGSGDWMYTPGYGYLWVSGYPWGYLPYQCGAWNFYDGFGWGWAPGMGGCNPWWFMGFYGGPNIGLAPPGYRRIVRPIGPQKPIPGRPIPMVAVNRRATFVNSGLPPRDRNTPVTIAGSTVKALRPLASRPVYNHAEFQGNSNTQTPRPAYGKIGPVTAAPVPGYRAPQPAPESHNFALPPASQNFASPPASHSSSPPPQSSPSGSSSSHSSGGGSSGGSHSSGGDGGGGGGGGHSGGGGGGGGHH